jgi:hypothetical protein
MCDFPAEKQKSYDCISIMTGLSVCSLVADSVEKLLQRILLAIFNRSGIWVRIYDSFRVFSLNHYCAKAAPKYSRESFSTESAQSGHSAAEQRPMTSFDRFR